MGYFEVPSPDSNCAFTSRAGSSVIDFFVLMATACEGRRCRRGNKLKSWASPPPQIILYFRQLFPLNTNTETTHAKNKNNRTPPPLSEHLLCTRSKARFWKTEMKQMQPLAWGSLAPRRGADVLTNNYHSVKCVITEVKTEFLSASPACEYRCGHINDNNSNFSASCTHQCLAVPRQGLQCAHE